MIIQTVLMDKEFGKIIVDMMDNVFVNISAVK